MRRTGSILRQQKDTCSCWACRDKKFRETRKTDKHKAMREEMKDIDLTLIILFIVFIIGMGIGKITEKPELNNEHGKQIDCLFITNQSEEKGVINKAKGLAANTPYYLGKMYDEVTPMAANDQFTMPVHKFGIPGKEPEYNYHSESLRLGLHTWENRKAVILNRSKKLAIG